MVNSAQKIDKSIQKMMTLGRRLGILFTALFIAVCCACSKNLDYRVAVCCSSNR